MKTTRFKPHPLAAALLMAQAGLALAQGPTLLPRVDVIGGADKLPEIAGSGQLVDDKELDLSRVFTVNEALRRVPGVHVRDEEGFGLRPNIGMRGLNPTRSTKITLLEDGIPLAYSPYGDNASYFHPMINRYDRIEVLKGAGALLFGPQTIGGVINYITPVPPQKFGGFVHGAAGNRAYFNGKLSVGGNGFLFDYTRKQGDGARDNTEHALDDFNLKYTAALGSRQAITLRASHATEDSQVTYSGLTLAEYQNLGARYNPFKNDYFDTRRTALSATHDFAFDDRTTLTTNLYYATYDRDWWRQSSNSTDGQHTGCNATVAIDGVTATFTAHRLAGRRVNPDTQFNCAQGRLRSYVTWGVEPRLTLAHAGGELQFGVKAHFEEQDRKQVNAGSPLGRSGTLAEDNLRETKAYAFFIAHRFDLGQFAITPILRYEHIDAERTNRLNGVAGSTQVKEFMPGLGVTWNPGKTLTVFASAHKGFAPPRVEDLIGGTGTATEVDAEESTNLELGLRALPLPGMSVQAAWFRSDFDNLIAVGSIAGGATPLSQGKALFEGLELSGRMEAKSGLFGRLAYTWLPTAEQSTAFRNVATGAPVGVQGNRQPYAPKHTLTAAVGYAAGPWRAELEAQQVGKQFTDFANTVAPSADGQRGEIAAWTVWNAALNYRFDKALSAFLTAKNLADKTYIVDRTRGIVVGMPRLVQIGARYDF
jgi:Fe(3+) dicitrate transport protein